MQHLYGSFVRTIVPMLQNVDAHHQANGLAVPADGTVINRQGLLETIPIDQAGGAQKFVIRMEHIREKGLKHMKLPRWNICFHFRYLYQFSRTKTTPFQQISSVFKELVQCFRGLYKAFFRTD